ncbi:RidA family protein [Hwanghaeella grinnelliae]|uniref:RidA family protein n=1 Tax=Hwanghaeella grinnelliae TaxID=2500179 RepID=A0A3S2VQQ9_9PROT|nr:RidA family protein [Hwanghaeella grinnelliae]RVU39394.1 RidA family protein [Hwanghaeella grinnelliae]
MTESGTASSAEARLKELGIDLPELPVPVANFALWRRDRDLVFLSGQVCEWNGPVTHTGKLGEVHDLAAGQAAARICGLNLLAVLRHALGGSLDPVSGCMRVGGFVHCTPSFPSVPMVINGASDLFHDIFGAETGAHARTAVGVMQLPKNAAVEVDAIFRVG